jgi:hypothetical protein
MPTKLLRLLSYSLLALCITASSHLLGTEAQSVNSGLTAHEWGTFTSVAGNDGQAVEWTPLAGSTDLPGFVEHFRDAGFKVGLRGTVRMETPVLYFYAPREMTLSVNVAFSNGVITEWYPRASRVEPSAALSDASLYQERTDGSIAWDSVTVVPGHAADFHRDNGDSHYYAARETSAAPLRVKTPVGVQQERFLFYRGVSVFPVSISTRLTSEGKLLVKNLGKEEVPSIILFERRGQSFGYRIGGALREEAILDSPALNATVDSLEKDLERILVAQGLYPDEARAMLKTWRHSWFEEGSRLLYIVPRRFVDAIVPLSINPAPAHVVRVFVGRLELVTPTTERAVEHAFASKDSVALGKYGRFLEPILKAMIQKESNPPKAKRLQGYLNSIYNSEIAQAQRRN